MIELIKNLLGKNKSERVIIKTERTIKNNNDGAFCLKEIDRIVEYEKSNYAFEMFAETVTENIKIEITFKKAEQCSTNLAEIKINGVDCDNPAYDLITRLSRAIETYHMDKAVSGQD